MKNKLIKSNNPFTYALIINILYIVVCFTLFYNKYESNDDIIMKMVMNGAYGERLSYSYFTNIFLGFFIKSLYSITCRIDWYTLFQYGITFIALTSLCTILLKLSIKNNKKSIGILICTILLIVSGRDLYLSINFTKTAGLISTAGYIWLIDYISDGKSNMRSIIFGDILLLIGAFIRFESMLLAGAFCFILFLIEFPKSCKQHSLKTYVSKYVFVFGPALIIILFCVNCNYNYNTFYKEYNTVRSNIVDRNYINYDKYAQQYKEIGISANDIEMLKTWSFDDPEFFTTEKLENIQRISKDIIGIEKSIETVLEFIFRATSYSICIFAVLMIIMYGICFKGFFIHILTLFMILLSYFYSTSTGRVIYRCEYIIWLSIFVVYSYRFLDKISLLNIRIKNRTLIVFLTLFLSLNLYNPLFKYRKVINENVELNVKFIELLKKNKNQLYLFDTTTLSMVEMNDLYDVYKTYEKNENGNILALGSWLTNHPINNYVLSKFGVENPFRDIIDKKIYIVDCQYIDKKTIYMQEHYNPNVFVRKIRSYNGINMYRYFSEDMSFSDEVKIAGTNSFNNINLFKNSSYTYINGEVSLSNEEALEREAIIEIYDSKDNILYSDIGTMYFDENLDFNHIEFSILNENIPKFDCYYKVYLEKDNELELLGEFKLDQESINENIAQD